MSPAFEPTLSGRGCDDRSALVDSGVLALDMLHVVQGTRKLRPGKVKLLAYRLCRVAGSNAVRKTTNGQKRGNELHIGYSIVELDAKATEDEHADTQVFKYKTFPGSDLDVTSELATH